MKNLETQRLMSCFDNTIEILYSLESIIKVTQETCRDKEFCSVYYNLQNNEKITLSQERNHYINLLSLALDKVSTLREVSDILEKELFKLK